MSVHPDWDKLRRQFYITDRPHEESIYQISFTELATEAGMKSFLEFYAPRLGSQGLQPAATFFCSWLMGIPLAVQYYLSTENQGLQFQLEHLTLHMYMSGPYCQFAFETSVWISREVEERLEVNEYSPARQTLRYHTLSNVYRDTLRPLMERMAELTNMNVRTLWRQLPARYFYFIEQWKAEASDDQLRSQFSEDMDYVLADLPGDIFGLARNPLHVKPRYTTNIQGDGQTLLRSSCCLYHELDSGEYCFNCPQLSESARAEKRLAYQTKEGTS